MSTQARGKDSLIDVRVDGQSLFTGRTSNFDWTPDQEIMKSTYLGQMVASADLKHEGNDFTFTLTEENADAINYIKMIADADANATAFPTVTVIVTQKYRSDGSRLTITFSGGTMIAKTRSINRDEYVTVDFEGFAPEITLKVH